jgi:hypothetical protein
MLIVNRIPRFAQEQSSMGKKLSHEDHQVPPRTPRNKDIEELAVVLPRLLWFSW